MAIRYGLTPVGHRRTDHRDLGDQGAGRSNSRARPSTTVGITHQLERRERQRRTDRSLDAELDEPQPDRKECHPDRQRWPARRTIGRARPGIGQPVSRQKMPANMPMISGLLRKILKNCSAMVPGD